MDIKIGRCRLYRHDIGEFMRRWIFQSPLGTVRLHNIREPDEDREMHDHPWDFVAVILRGGYVEDIPAPATWPGLCAYPPEEDADPTWTERLVRWPGSVVYHRASDAHRISKLLRDEAWTLVITGPRIRKWGFWTKDVGWVYWRDFRSAKLRADGDDTARRNYLAGVVKHTRSALGVVLG